MKQSFSRRILLTVGLSTCLIMSLYWLAGWQVIERMEAQNVEHFTGYIGAQVDRVLASEAPATTLEFFDILHFYANRDALPEGLAAFAAAGIHQLPNDNLLVARPHPLTGELYYIVLQQLEELLESEAQETAEIGLVMGGIALITFGAMGLTLLITWQLTVPIRQLSRQLADIDPTNPRLQPLQRNDEIGFMSRQFASLLERVSAFIQRERDFTRFASHELRSPVMVIRSSADLLRERMPADSLNGRALQRIDAATTRMSQLIEAFLWLGRESKAGTTTIDQAGLKTVIEERLGTHPDLQARVSSLALSPCSWPIPPFILSVIIDNLLRNALLHGSGDIDISNDADSLLIRNRIGDMAPAAQDSHGYGLIIVEQLCAQANCRFVLEHGAQQFSARLIFTPA
ncbi:histidine kinase dimerization/phospho-acceptor domain-containing protein [Marinobacterium rhizophilum]|uniref:histidine kinase dimerization/phospho-acceptor domain-containing protein n=1 Tax=Marinobacterium rhizophilum TaxID=420402 RepID=UPI0003A61F74|nr:HAMP domain-containing sensor histidine kinase [Marinobacterium rhizophilum]